MDTLDQLPVSPSWKAEARALGELNKLMDVLGLTTKQDARLAEAIGTLLSAACSSAIECDRHRVDKPTDPHTGIPVLGYSFKDWRGMHAD